MIAGPAAADVLGKIRLPGIGLHHIGNRAAAVFVQQSVRRLPGLRRTRPRDRRSMPIWSFPRRAPRCGGRHRAMVALDLALLHPDPRSPGAALQVQRSMPVEGSAAQGPATPFCTARATEAIRFVYDDGLRSYETNKPFEGVITNLERRFSETESEWAREELTRYSYRHALQRLPRPPPQARSAGGEDRWPRYRRSHRDDVVKRAGDMVCGASRNADAKHNEIAGRILKEIRERLSSSPMSGSNI